MSIDSGTATASSADGGVTVTLGGGDTFDAAVIAGTTLRDTTSGKQAVVKVRNSNINLTMFSGLAGSFSNHDWVVFNNFPSVQMQVSNDLSVFDGSPKILSAIHKPNRNPSARSRWQASQPLTLIDACIDLAISATWLSPTSVRIDFNTPVIDNAALRNPDNYLITPQQPTIIDPRAQVVVLGVTPEAVPTPGYVILATEEHTTGQIYDIEALAIEKTG